MACDSDGFFYDGANGKRKAAAAEGNVLSILSTRGYKQRKNGSFFRQAFYDNMDVHNQI